MITNLHEQMRENIQKIVSETYNVDTTTAKDIIKEMSFAEYLRMLEATGDIPTTNMGQSSGPVSPNDQTIDYSKSKKGDEAFVLDANGDEQAATIISQSNGAYKLDTGDGQIFSVTQDKLLNPAQLKNKKLVNSTKSYLSQLGSALKTGATRGQSMGAAQKVTMNASEDHDELRRIQELAGIEETSTAGATAPGGIASSPSIVGNTAHKPTDRLRARLRRENEKKKKK